MTVAYLANLFPSPVEPYVVEEIGELRSRGVQVVPCSARKASTAHLPVKLRRLSAETVYLQPLDPWLVLQAFWLCACRISQLAELLVRVTARGRESPLRRLRALLHTLLGACLALRLAGLGVQHIHVHHGYFSSWIALVAARLLGIGFSMTLHGSDLLLHGAYFDTKLAHCRFCVTVSEFNRRHILCNYPQVASEKVFVRRLGVSPLQPALPVARANTEESCNLLLAVGRLHAVKDHAFLIRACQKLKEDGLTFLCLIAGEGPERHRLERLITANHLGAEVRLLGHVPHETLDAYYAMADVVILTSRSEGIPLTLMEAMAQGKPVLAPRITGIPELVVDGVTGYLYPPGLLKDFVARLETICRRKSELESLGQAARRYVFRYFNREKNLAEFGDLFLDRIGHGKEESLDEDLVLQQI